MGLRKIQMGKGCFYHVFSRSIAGFEIFRFAEEYQRIIEAFRFYQYRRLPNMLGLAHALRKAPFVIEPHTGEALVRIISYCIMPTHIHLFLEQKAKDGISEFMRLVLNSYARYFNSKIEREGPLWSSRFKYVLVENDEQSLHLTRYIHLNPTSAGLVEKPLDWTYSSYGEYIGSACNNKICNFRDLIAMNQNCYRKFVESRIHDQRSLQILKSQIFD